MQNTTDLLRECLPPIWLETQLPGKLASQLKIHEEDWQAAFPNNSTETLAQLLVCCREMLEQRVFLSAMDALRRKECATFSEKYFQLSDPHERRALWDKQMKGLDTLNDRILALPNAQREQLFFDGVLHPESSIVSGTVILFRSRMGTSISQKLPYCDDVGQGNPHEHFWRGGFSRKAAAGYRPPAVSHDAEHASGIIALKGVFNPLSR